jgi:hypothetical protein
VVCPARRSAAYCRHVLQGTAKQLRRARRALLLGARDPYLAGLFPKVEAATAQVMNALTEVVTAHATLRGSMQSGLVPGVWGVIQHAFNMVHQQVTTAGCGAQHLMRSPVIFGACVHLLMARHMYCAVTFGSEVVPEPPRVMCS